MTYNLTDTFTSWDFGTYPTLEAAQEQMSAYVADDIADDEYIAHSYSIYLIDEDGDRRDLIEQSDNN